MKLKAMKLIVVTGILLVWVAAFGVIGELDYQDKVKEMEHYCSMVENQLWPNYKNIQCD